MLLWCCVAQAAVPVVLGPDGPLRLGPAPTVSGPDMGVDPETGMLVLEDRDRDGLVRRWVEDRWTVGGTHLKPPEAAGPERGWDGTL